MYDKFKIEIEDIKKEYPAVYSQIIQDNKLNNDCVYDINYYFRYTKNSYKSTVEYKNIESDNYELNPISVLNGIKENYMDTCIFVNYKKTHNNYNYNIFYYIDIDVYIPKFLIDDYKSKIKPNYNKYQKVCKIANNLNMLLDRLESSEKCYIEYSYTFDYFKLNNNPTLKQLLSVSDRLKYIYNNKADGDKLIFYYPDEYSDKWGFHIKDIVCVISNITPGVYPSNPITIYLYDKEFKTISAFELSLIDNSIKYYCYHYPYNIIDKFTEGSVFDLNFDRKLNYKPKFYKWTKKEIKGIFKNQIYYRLKNE